MAAFFMLQYYRRRMLRRNRIFRDRMNPLDSYNDEEMLRKFRFRRIDILAMTDELKDKIEHPFRKGALSPVLQVMLTLRFYACGSFQDSCAKLIGVNQSTASRTITRVTEAFLIWVPHWIKFPTQGQADTTKKKFYSKYGMPNVVGCLDGTHVRIQAPFEYEHEYINKKNSHSINVQVICDADMMFINIIAKWPGSVTDARILRESSLFAAFESSEKPVQGCLLAGNGYLPRDWLLTPLANSVSEKEKNYNVCHRATRNTVKQCIGIAKRRWHCLNKLRVQPAKACQIITVCFMLHNRAKYLELEDPDSDIDSDAESESDPDDSDSESDLNDIDLSYRGQVTERTSVFAGKALRAKLIHSYF